MYQPSDPLPHVDPLPNVLNRTGEMMQAVYWEHAPSFARVIMPITGADLPRPHYPRRALDDVTLYRGDVPDDAVVLHVGRVVEIVITATSRVLIYLEQETVDLGTYQIAGHGSWPAKHRIELIEGDERLELMELRGGWMLGDKTEITYTRETGPVPAGAGGRFGTSMEDMEAARERTRRFNATLANRDAARES